MCWGSSIEEQVEEVEISLPTGVLRSPANNYTPGATKLSGCVEICSVGYLDSINSKRIGTALTVLNNPGARVERSESIENSEKRN